VKRTKTEALDKTGHVVRLATPDVSIERTLFVIRDDGVRFGPGGDTPLTDLGLPVQLGSPPRDDACWRAESVKAFHQGQRPEPAQVFQRLTAVYNTFIDFQNSLGTQETMCELSACLSLMTWLHDAFTVLPYPWPNGERGSGKTHWLTCWAMTSYLGHVLLSSGSFAALRDLAQQGATLAFDDAEILGDVRRSDPNKRELFLAGNRKGAVVPLKEPDGQRTWATRWVNAYCPRGFTAIKTPDPVLGSRVIVLPLARTADPRRGNADPADEASWPETPRQLQDDLWTLALMLLSQASTVWHEVGQDPDTFGREFEPWRAVLTVARLLEPIFPPNPKR
jgi:hypothetical protein